ncbi:MAG: type ISP restriction/modification enzyme [Microthrixaceae bacterium]
MSSTTCTSTTCEGTRGLLVSFVARKAGNVFEVGSRATVAVAILVKQPGEVPASGAVLHYRDIGDYLNRDEKLAILAKGLPAADGDSPSLADLDWTTITPNEHGDWINQRSESFTTHLPAHDDKAPSIFELRSNGLKTNRDAWNYNSSREKLDCERRADDRPLQQPGRRVTQAQSIVRSESTKARAEAAKVIRGPGPERNSVGTGRTSPTLPKGSDYRDGDRLVLEATYRPFHRRWVEAGRRLEQHASTNYHGSSRTPMPRT